MRMEVFAQRLGRAAEIADAHRAGIGVAVDLVERVHLHGADEGDQGVGQRVDAVRQEADDEKKRDLLDQDQLPPVQLPEIAEAHVDELRRHRAEHEGQERDRIPEAHGPVAPQQRRAQKHDVARLRVGKDLPAADIGIGVLKAARERDEHGRLERVGHLPVKSGFEVQVARLLCVFLRVGTQTHSLYRKAPKK